MISNDDFKAISDLDLEPIKIKLMHQPSGESWSAEKANAVEIEYRRFLYLMKAFPTEQIAPLVDVDTFWHYHILDTMKYASDCEQAFGYFVHHYPYVGILGENGEEEREAGGNRMEKLYEQTFGDSYHLAARAIDTAGEIGAAANATSGRTAYCWLVPPPPPAVSARQVAYCWLVPPPPPAVSAKQVAYCWLVPPPPPGVTGKQVAYRTQGRQQTADCVATNDVAYGAGRTRLAGNLIPYTDLERLAA